MYMSCNPSTVKLVRRESAILNIAHHEMGVAALKLAGVVNKSGRSRKIFRARAIQHPP